MSHSYSANQYDGAFKPQRLQNWSEDKQLKERPSARMGRTMFIADERGHLHPGAKKGSAWPDFIGTWNLPACIPVCRINPTSRSVEGLNRLKSWGLDPQHTSTCHPHKGIRNTNRLQKAKEQANMDEQQSGISQSSAAEDQPASQNIPLTGGEQPASQSHDLQAAMVGTTDQPAEEKAAGETPSAEPELCS